MNKTFSLYLTNSFKKDFKKIKNQHKNIKILEKVVVLLLKNEPLPAKYKDHALIGNWKGHRECHLEPDWLLIYYKDFDKLILTLTRTGSHSNLFV